MRSGLGRKRWYALWAAIAVCALTAALAASSSALEVMCSPNASGTQTCRGTDSFTYAGPDNLGCPPAGSTDTLTIDEEVAKDASKVTGTWGNDPAAVCGGITDGSGTPYKQGDALRGGAFKLDSSGHRVVGPKGGYVWEWTVQVRGAGAGGDHPSLVVDVTYDKPTQSTGGGGGGGTAAGGCDWTVLVVKAPKHTKKVPVPYTIGVHNRGEGDCPATTLTVDLIGGVATEFEYVPPGAPPHRGSVFASPYHLAVPALASGASEILPGLRAFPALSAMGSGNNYIEVRARLPGDVDSPTGEDEVAIVTTKLKPRMIHTGGGQVDSSGQGTLTVECPAGEHKNDRCTFKLEVIDTPLPQERVLLAPLGTAQGSVPAGHDAEIALRLREAGRKILDRRHQIMETVIGTRTEDGVSTLVEGHLILKR